MVLNDVSIKLSQFENTLKSVISKVIVNLLIMNNLFSKSNTTLH